jgi:sugar lactone lactonase YvrE
MKIYFLFVMLLAGISLNAQEHTLEKLWETDSIIAIPESVLPDLKGEGLYISLIDGGGWDADGKGGVAKLDVYGEKYNPDWVTGLNAPKGLGLYKNYLYVADISEVVVIYKLAGRIEKKIKIDSTTGLNDITVDEANGIVYVSDSRKGRIWRIENDKPTLYLDSVKGVNGLKVVGTDLLIGAGKNFIKADKNKKITKIAELPQGIDGIEPVGNGDYIVTSWAGYIFYVYPDGRFETLLDTHLEKKNTADIGYDPGKNIVYVPTFNAKRITAYRLKSK